MSSLPSAPDATCRNRAGLCLGEGNLGLKMGPLTQIDSELKDEPSPRGYFMKCRPQISRWLRDRVHTLIHLPEGHWFEPRKCPLELS